MAMSISSSSVRWFAFLFALVTGADLCCPAVLAAEDEPAAGEVVVSDDANFEVPDGDAATLLAFIEKVANPQQQFTSDAELKGYLENAATALSDATAKILAGEATDQQMIDAIEWKLESLRIRQKLGDENADKETGEFLAGLQFDSRPGVTKAIEEIRQNRAAMQVQVELMTKLRQWPRMDESQRADTTDWLVNAVKSGGAGGSYASMVTMFCDSLAGTPDSALAQRALSELIPLFRTNDSPEVQKRLPMLEGIERRLNLPGNSIEVSGTYLDGTKLDWASYRGKVVLVDYWATWCGPCRAEVPNILQNYLKYHDKGFEVIGISLDDTREAAEEYVKQTNIPWPSLFHESSDGSGWQNPMAVRYGITGIPTAILVDQEGKVVSMNARGPRLAAELEKLLGKSSEDEASAVEVSDQSERTVQNGNR
jgi:thiol-disulfide isomerase/thioredoxin